MAAHRYWRIFINSVNLPANEYCTLVEVELRTAIGGADVTTAATPVTASSFFGGSPGSNVVDNSDATVWITNQNNVSPANPCWLQFDLGTPKAIVEIMLRALSGYASRAPKAFAVQFSDDGVTWPAFNQQIPDQTNWEGSLTRSFALSFSSLRGNAKLDSGVRADRVLVYEWDSPHALVAPLVPATNGDWETNAVGGKKYLVTTVGPAGYQPITHGPVVPVED